MVFIFQSVNVVYTVICISVFFPHVVQNVMFPKGKVKVFVSQSSPTLWDPMDCSLPASLSMGFSRQEYWNE